MPPEPTVRTSSHRPRRCPSLLRPRSRAGKLQVSNMKYRKLAPHSGPSAVPSGAAPLKRMYAITFDMQTEVLRQTYPRPQSWLSAYDDIKSVLADYGFSDQQGSLYFGDAEKATPVQCVLAVQELTRRFPWFAGAVGDIRMLRIEENNDLMPAIEEMRDALAAAAEPVG